MSKPLVHQAPGQHGVGMGGMGPQWLGSWPRYAGPPVLPGLGGFPPRFNGGGSPPSSYPHPGGRQGDTLSRTNLYIRGLSPHTTDKDLVNLCQKWVERERERTILLNTYLIRYGPIISTKAILDKATNRCKGYGFVDFESPTSALAAVNELQGQGIQVNLN